MMDYFMRLVAVTVLLFLSGCATPPKNPMSAQQMQTCKMACMKQYHFCASKCVDNCPTCSAKAHQFAARNYAKYLNELKIEGGINDRELNSYRDPLQCRKISCNCVADFNTCNQGCTGVIQKRLLNVPYCT